MGGQCHNLIIKCGNDKLDGILWNAFNTLLDNMIPILISNATHSMTIKLCDHFGLLIQINNLYCLKYSRRHKNRENVRYFTVMCHRRNPYNSMMHRKCIYWIINLPISIS
ncbi:hypothetical protein H5410_030828 [Solanum commersonii]|uniref:Uncharacterized protein n=1 Tax=Solanum commersonii TaxID=4109 RepID=A0A9J5YGP8_SOLCO|nr:hypothetical protein H5410_030828 [Solanum commersonii]